jgi:hypothetical protein
MKLTKKHIGQLFDVNGGDGSWCYELIDVKGNDLLFYTFAGRHEIDSNKFKDWRPFVPTYHMNKKWVKLGWETGRRSK